MVMSMKTSWCVMWCWCIWSCWNLEAEIGREALVLTQLRLGKEKRFTTGESQAQCFEHLVCALEECYELLKL